MAERCEMGSDSLIVLAMALSVKGINIATFQLQERINSITRLLINDSQPLGIALTGLFIQFIRPVATVLVLGILQLPLAAIVTLSLSRCLFALTR